jgi:hypothetical protein
LLLLLSTRFGDCIFPLFVKEFIMPTNPKSGQGKSDSSDKKTSGSRSGTSSGGTHEQHVEAGRQSHKNDSGGSSGSSGSKQASSGGTRGGTPEQHAEAGRQSHKNDHS